MKLLICGLPVIHTYTLEVVIKQKVVMARMSVYGVFGEIRAGERRSSVCELPEEINTVETGLG
jgi:hypothetical protein